MNIAPQLPPWQLKALILSIGVTLVAYLLFSMWGGWQQVIDTVGRIGIWGVLAALLMSILNYAMRFFRWQWYLKILGHRLPWQQHLKIYLAGFAFTTTPGKAGEALRSLLLKPLGIPHASSLAAFLSERLSDLLAVVLLALFGLYRYPAAQPLILIGLGLVATCYTPLIYPRLLKRLQVATSRLKGKAALINKAVGVMFLAQRCHRPLSIAFCTALGLFAWLAEAVAFFWILQWAGIDTSLNFAVFVYAVAMLAGAISFMPGGLGGSEAAMVALLVWQGASTADAIATTLIIRLTTLWFATFLGLCALMKTKYSL